MQAIEWFVGHGWMCRPACKLALQTMTCFFFFTRGDHPTGPYGPKSCSGVNRITSLKPSEATHIHSLQPEGPGPAQSPSHSPQMHVQSCCHSSCLGPPSVLVIGARGEHADAAAQRQALALWSHTSHTYTCWRRIASQSVFASQTHTKEAKHSAAAGSSGEPMASSPPSLFRLLPLATFGKSGQHSKPLAISVPAHHPTQHHVSANPCSSDSAAGIAVAAAVVAAAQKAQKACPLLGCVLDDQRVVLVWDAAHALVHLVCPGHDEHHHGSHAQHGHPPGEADALRGPPQGGRNSFSNSSTSGVDGGPRTPVVFPQAAHVEAQAAKRAPDRRGRARPEGRHAPGGCRGGRG